MANVKKTSCCGLRELEGIRNDFGVGKYTGTMAIQSMLIELLKDPKFGAFFFTDTMRSGRGEILAKILEESNTGTISRVQSFLNPNTSEYVETFVFAFDKDKFLEFGNEYIKKMYKNKKLRLPKQDLRPGDIVTGVGGSAHGVVTVGNYGLSANVTVDFPNYRDYVIGSDSLTLVIKAKKSQ